MKILLIAALLALSGCAQYSMLTRVAAEEGARVADESLKSAKFVQCYGITIGAWVREYGGNALKANAWRMMCGFDETVALPRREYGFN